MNRDDREAKTLLTAGEFRLYAASRGDSLDRLSEAELEDRLRRTRRLRDKYRDLYRRQRGGARGKTPQGRPSELHDFTGTRRKAELFEELARRLEARRAALEEERRRKRLEEIARRREEEILRRPPRRGGTKGRAFPPVHAGAGPLRIPSGAPPPRPGRAVRRILALSTSGHFRSSHRRFQARRDSRR